MKSLKNIALISFLVPFLVSPIKDTAIPKKVPTLRPKTIYYERYLEYISPLIEHVETKGFQLKHLLQDPRFEIYEKLGNLYRPSKKGRRLSLEQYMKKYESRKKRISGFIKDKIYQLKLAEITHGISRHITAAIIGVESNFGDDIGDLNPFNACFSMYVYNRRRDLAKDELEALLILGEKRHIDIFNLKSNYMTAMSYGQFIPSSVNQWFEGEELYDMNNCILSVANYLAHFKKETGSIEKAIFEYNNDNRYVQTVLDLAKYAEKNFFKSKN